MTPTSPSAYDLFLCVVCYIASQILHYRAMRYVTNWGMSIGFTTTGQRLPDKGFERVPEMRFPRRPSEHIIGFVLPMQGVAAVIESGFSLRPIQLFMWLHMACTLLRIITFSCTLLPDASGTCQYRDGKSIGGCHDLLFSGHQSAVVCVQVAMAYTFGFQWWITLAGAVVTVVNALCIISQRDHYTVDVVVGTYVPLLVAASGLAGAV